MSGGLPRFAIVGLPDSAVRESAERVRAAVKRAGLDWPAGRITVNLAPAGLRKGGSGLDLAIAVAVLAASGSLPAARVEGAAFFGELSLSGEVRPVPGALAVARAVAAAGPKLLLTAAGCAREAALVPELSVHAVASLVEALALLRRPPGQRPAPTPCAATAALGQAAVGAGPDLEDVRGQTAARRALEIAAAGGHNLLFFGPPGSGKSMLARRLPGILPPPDLEEALEITQVASCAGLTSGQGLVTSRPFRAPHHTLTGPALVGGGALPRPGEVSLAHGGVLFLDELPEFPRHVLDLLRQPLEEGGVVLARAGRTARFPARFLLVAAMNPCPCGWLGDAHRPCTCTPHAVARYRGRLSGPLLDRIDLHVEVPRVEPAALRDTRSGENSRAVVERVAAARAIQAERYRGETLRVNAELDGGGVRRHCAPVPAAGKLLERAMTALSLSARAHDRILKVARTLADLHHEAEINETRVAEAIACRALDRGAMEAPV